MKHLHNTPAILIVWSRLSLTIFKQHYPDFYQSDYVPIFDSKNIWSNPFFEKSPGFPYYSNYLYWMHFGMINILFVNGVFRKETIGYNGLLYHINRSIQ